MTTVDSDLNRLIGLPDGHRLSRGDAFDLHSYFVSLTGKSLPVSPVVLMLYVDKNGDFTKMKTERDKLVKQIFNNMSKEDQFNILTYINIEYEEEE